MNNRNTKNGEMIADRIWRIAEQLLEVEDQESVAPAIESLSLLSQELQCVEADRLLGPTLSDFRPMEATIH